MSGLDFLIGNSLVLMICRWLLILFILLNIRGAFRLSSKGGTGYLMLLFVMILYCVFYSPSVGDNYTSTENYYSYLSGVDSAQLHLEDIYFRIMDIIPFGYVYYRLFLWGIACLLCVWLLKKMRIKSQIATLAVLSFALPLLLYYQRAAFAYVLLYVALYSFLSKGALFDSLPLLKNLLKKNYQIISVILLLCALPFHRTMPVYITVLLGSLFVPKNKFGVLVLLVVLLLFSASVLSNTLLLLDYFQEDTRDTAMVYLETDTGIVGQNINGFVAYMLRALPLYCMLLIGLFKMIKTPLHYEEIEKVCLINTLVLIVISILFMGDSFSIQIKFRNAAMMPWTIFLASYYNRNSGSKLCSAYAVATILTSLI